MSVAIVADVFLEHWTWCKNAKSQFQLCLINVFAPQISRKMIQRRPAMQLVADRLQHSHNSHSGIAHYAAAATMDNVVSWVWKSLQPPNVAMAPLNSKLFKNVCNSFDTKGRFWWQFSLLVDSNPHPTRAPLHRFQQWLCRILHT